MLEHLIYKVYLGKLSGGTIEQKQGYRVVKDLVELLLPTFLTVFLLLNIFCLEIALCLKLLER